MYHLAVLPHEEFIRLCHQVHEQADSDTKIDCASYKLMDPFEALPGTFAHMYMNVSFERTLDVWYSQDRREMFFTSNNELRLHVTLAQSDADKRFAKIPKIITIVGVRP